MLFRKSKKEPRDPDAINQIITDFLDMEMEKLRLLFPNERLFSIAIYLRTLRFSTMPHTDIGNVPDFSTSRAGEDVRALWYAVMYRAEERGYVTQSIPETESPYILSFSKIFED